MENSLHYLLLKTHTTMQKQILHNIKEFGLTMGQPKVLDYLLEYDGAIQKDIASGCFIEPASISSILNGMEKNELVVRKMNPDNRRNYHVYLTEKGRKIAEQLQGEFAVVEKHALAGFDENEIDRMTQYLRRVYSNLER